MNDLVNQLLATGIIMKTGPVIYVDAGWYRLPLDAKRGAAASLACYSNGDPNAFVTFHDGYSGKKVATYRNGSLITY